MGDFSRAIEPPDPPTWRDVVARDRWGDAVRNRVADVVGQEGDVARRGWLLWREAERCKQIGMFGLATWILDQADELVTEAAWTPVWAQEYAVLRLSLLQDDAEEAQALEWLQRAFGAWLYVGDSLIGESDDGPDPAILRGAEEMYLALIGPERLEQVWERLGGNVEDVILATWLSERWAAAVHEVVARVGGLVALRSYDDARAFATELLDHVRRWGTPEALLDAALIEAGLQLQLSAQSAAAGLEEEALARAEAGLRVLEKARRGPAQAREEARLRTNRANSLVRLGRLESALAEFETAQAMFEGLGETTNALRCRQGAMVTRFFRGEALEPETLGRFISEFEGVIDQLTHSDGGAMHDLEQARRLHLSLLARPGSGASLEDVISVLEAIRGAPPMVRRAAGWDDPTVARVAAPFGVAGARLAALGDTLLLVHEPGVEGHLFLIVAGRDGAAVRWQFVGGTRQINRAWSELAAAAEQERQRLVAGEIPLRSSPSRRFLDAADEAWSSLPTELHHAIDQARTIFYLPSAMWDLDVSQIELLRRDGQWLGTTHVVVRCPSLQYLESLLAPNRASWPDEASATVVQASPSEAFGPLDAAEEDTATAMRAMQILGFEPKRREVLTRDDGLAVLTTGRLLHYVGHGLASRIGEVLPLSTDVALSPTALVSRGEGRMPFVYLSACLLARTRHVRGGRQKGWAVALLERGAPGVIGALFGVPDEVCPLVTESFYRGAWKSTVGEGMRRARADLDGQGVNPVAWAAFVLMGDPNFVLSTSAANVPERTADLTRRWPASLIRHRATKLTRYLDEARRGMRRDEGLNRNPAALRGVQAWLDDARGERVLAEDVVARAVDELIEFDLEGAAALRIVLALARAESSSPEDRPGKIRDELGAAWLIADALDDTYAMLVVADGLVRLGEVAWSPEELLIMVHNAARLLRSLPQDEEALDWLARNLRMAGGRLRSSGLQHSPHA